MIFLNVYVEQANMNGKTEKSIIRNFIFLSIRIVPMQRQYKENIKEIFNT